MSINYELDKWIESKWRRDTRLYTLTMSQNVFEGIHTIKPIKHGETNKVLMFDSKADAESYAVQLTQPNFPAPSVEAIDVEEVQDFCQNAGYICEFIPAGTQIEPPAENIPEEQRDWHPSKERVTP
jgi:hypothetical protein